MTEDQSITEFLGNGKVALVTGAAHGIGRAIAAWLLVEGWRVVLADIDRDRGAEVAAALGEHAAFVALDVADEMQVGEAVGQALERFGRLDALVNNAGVADPNRPPLEDLPLARWNRILGVNLRGPMLMSKHCTPHLRRQQGAIVNICSTRIHQSQPHWEAYAASKGGLLALTQATSISLAPDVRVNAVSPGWIDSRDAIERASEPLTAAHQAHHPVGRVGQVEDVAALVAWLLSSRAKFITGQEFIVDGGAGRMMSCPS